MIGFCLPLVFLVASCLSIIHGHDGITCGNGWAAFEKHCYYFSSSASTFKDAMLTCYRLGANMLELQSAEEEKWIDLQCRIRGYQYGVWLGACDLQQEGTFISVSNAKALPYTNWIKGEPNNNLGIEHCALYFVKYRRWNDGHCNHKVNYACKKMK
ncbi:perlucin-like protein [Saccostrea cucullata]|uniref:perlucin-like protein n=1 Tax=Saccostrea cuccullata TaxID=36930 RepID=UPI002ED2345B